MATTPQPSQSPLERLDDWDDFLEGRYKEGKAESEFRQYDAKANPSVAEFYRVNHEKQTVAYVLDKEKQYFGLHRGQKSLPVNTGERKYGTETEEVYNAATNWKCTLGKLLVC